MTLVKTRSFLRLLPLLCCLVLAASHPARAAGEAAPALPRFDIFEYVVEGNSRLSDLDIERAVTPFLGEGRSLLDVEGARAALERSYRDGGYSTVLVTIPEQEVAGGAVTLSVVEGEVERLRVKGAEYHLTSDIKSRAPELAQGNVPYFPDVQRQLESLNRNGDLRVTPIMRAGREQGKVEIVLDVEDHLPFHGSADFSNRQTANTTPQRASVNLRYDNLWQLGHSINLTLQTAPQEPSQQRVAALTYVFPVGDRGNAVALYGVASRSNLATLAGSPGLGLLGNTDIFGLRYAMPLAAAAEYSHSLSLGFDYKSIKQSVVVAGSAELPTPINYMPLVASYSGSWLGQSGTTAFDSIVTMGMRGLFGNHEDVFEAKRSGAHASFLTLRNTLRRTELVGRWSVDGRVEMQHASGPLVSNEQYGAGGAENVRGYLESERVGDGALRLGLEIRTPKITQPAGGYPLSVAGVIFFDGVRLRTLQPGLLQPDVRTLRGSGFGLRASAPGGVSFDLDWAVAHDDGDQTRAGDHRIHSRLLWEF